MTATCQRSLRLPISADVALVSLDTAAAALGQHKDRVTELLDGEWPWAWDLSTGRREVREVRVWRGNWQLPIGNCQLEAVIADVIGTGAPNVRGAMLETRWSVSGPTLFRLHRQGEVRGRKVGHTLWLERASLVALLERRLLR